MHCLSDEIRKACEALPVLAQPSLIATLLLLHCSCSCRGLLDGNDCVFEKKEMEQDQQRSRRVAEMEEHRQVRLQRDRDQRRSMRAAETVEQRHAMRAPADQPAEGQAACIQTDTVSTLLMQGWGLLTVTPINSLNYVVCFFFPPTACIHTCSYQYV